MTRELKFRAWNGNRMDYDCRHTTVWNGILVPEGDNILMQYTGLKDKNGTEIYEGDLVSFKPYGCPNTGEIYWCNSQWRIGSFALHYFTEGRLEVVGNIYEGEVPNESNI